MGCAAVMWGGGAFAGTLGNDLRVLVAVDAKRCR